MPKFLSYAFITHLTIVAEGHSRGTSGRFKFMINISFCYHLTITCNSKLLGGQSPAIGVKEIHL
jgi:hypothetical protein